MIKKYQNFLNEEVGLKNISKIAKLYKTSEIYFHKDLDGVTSAIAMKEFLKNYYQIETVVRLQMHQRQQHDQLVESLE